MREGIKKRPLSVEEAGWIDHSTMEISRLSDTISELADTLVMLSELEEVNGLDPYYRKGLCKDGVMAIAYGIKELSRCITGHQEHIDDTLYGLIAAETKGRRECVARW